MGAKERRDHYPLHVNIELSLEHTDSAKMGRGQWDFDRLAACLQKGLDREPLVEAVEKRLGEEFRQGGVSSDADWEQLIGILQEEGQMLFGRQTFGQQYEDMKQERMELLQARGDLRERAEQAGEEELGELQMTLARVTARCQAERRRERSRYKEAFEEDFRQAWRRRDDATVYKISIRLAGTGMGVRKRRMRSRRVTRATKEEWESFFSAPADQGGFAAEAFDFEKRHKEYKASWGEEELRPWTPDIASKAREDVRGVKGVLLRAKRRKACLPWGVPGETWAALLALDWRRSTEGLGIGLVEMRAEGPGGVEVLKHKRAVDSQSAQGTEGHHGEDPQDWSPPILWCTSYVGRCRQRQWGGGPQRTEGLPLAGLLGGCILQAEVCTARMPPRWRGCTH